MQGEKVRSLGGEEGRGDLKRTARSEREELSVWLNPKFKAIIKLKKGGKNGFTSNYRHITHYSLPILPIIIKALYLIITHHLSPIKKGHDSHRIPVLDTRL